MNDDKLNHSKAIKSFLDGTDKLKFSVPKPNRYEWIASILKRTNYFKLTTLSGPAYLNVPIILNSAVES
jgi:phenylalanine-4-hydroxylase